MAKTTCNVLGDFLQVLAVFMNWWAKGQSDSLYEPNPLDPEASTGFMSIGKVVQGKKASGIHRFFSTFVPGVSPLKQS